MSLSNFNFKKHRALSFKNKTFYKLVESFVFCILNKLSISALNNFKFVCYEILLADLKSLFFFIKNNF